MDKEKIDTIINSVFCLINAIFFIVDACLWPHDAIWVFVLAIIFSIVMDAFICAALFHPDWYIYMSSMHPYLFRNRSLRNENLRPFRSKNLWGLAIGRLCTQYLISVSRPNLFHHLFNDNARKISLFSFFDFALRRILGILKDYFPNLIRNHMAFAGIFDGINGSDDIRFHLAILEG
jgi:hypothetical protein